MKTTDLPTVNRFLAQAYARQDAPVVELIAVHTGDPFRVLVSTILSARTKDQTTADVTRRLFAEVDSVDALRRVSLERLETLVYPAGFYRTKAKHLKAMPAVLDAECDGRIPQTIDDLCRLPGVGRKTANLVVSLAFNKPGICVDVHVHRICNRLGFVATDTPYDTEMALRATLPKRYWKRWNAYLVSYGQTVCKPRRPACEHCAIRPYCDRVGVTD